MQFGTNDVVRFKSKFTIDDNGCHIWNAVNGKDRYGAFKLNGKKIDSHRASYLFFNGEIQQGLYVCHKCDVKACVNPGHLFIGTQSDNMQDCKKKDRFIVNVKRKKFTNGHTPANSSISNEEAILIKNAIKNKVISLKKLSIELNKPYQLLRDISCGRIYKCSAL